MTRLILSILFFLFVIQPLMGQSIDSLTDIIISYGRNHSSWGTPGVYATGETIQLKPTQTNDFKITRYFRINASASDDGKTFSTDTIELNTQNLKIIPKAKIEYWFTQLNTNKENFTSSFIEPLLMPLTKKEIFKAAKKYDLLWMLKGRDAYKPDTKSAIKQLQTFYRFDSFIVYKKPSIEYDIFTIDSYNSMKVFAITIKDTAEYTCLFHEPLGQPVNRYNNKNYMSGSRVINLEANTSAQSFLPQNSMIKKVLDINNIKEVYIQWYLSNVF